MKPIVLVASVNSIKKHCFLVLAAILLFSTGVSADIDDFPPPPRSTVESVAGSVTAMGMQLNIRKFTTRTSMEQVQKFYRKLWDGDDVAESEMPPWTMIGAIVDGEYHNVQMQSSGNSTWGYLSISDLPEKLKNKTIKPPSGHNFPKMSGSMVLDNQVSKDPGKTGRTILLSNDFSVKSNHDFYKSHLQNKGWRIVMDQQTEPRQAAYAMYATKGSTSMSLTINKVDGKTMIVGNEVKRGLLR